MNRYCYEKMLMVHDVWPLFFERSLLETSVTDDQDLVHVLVKLSLLHSSRNPFIRQNFPNQTTPAIPHPCRVFFGFSSRSILSLCYLFTEL